MGIYENEIDLVTMNALQENDGYDIPWEFIRRRMASKSPTSTASANAAILVPCKNDIGSTSEPSEFNRPGFNNENDITTLEAGVDDGGVIIGSGNMNCNYVPGGESSSNGGQRVKKTPPKVAAKPSIKLDGSVRPNGGRNETSSPPMNCKKMPNDLPMNGVMSNTPPCGIRAQRLRKERYSNGASTPVGTVSAAYASSSKNLGPCEVADELSKCVVWEYRKPEHDFRPQCEYDAPWDSKRHSSSNRDNNTPFCLCRNSGAALVDEMRKSSDGDAVYDEPWDIGKNGDEKKHQIDVAMRPGKTETTTASNSPSTTSRGSAVLTISSNESDGSAECRRSLPYKGQIPGVISMNAANGQRGREETGDKVVNGAARTPIRMETAFCSKSSQSTPVGNSKKRFQDKDRLIQQIFAAESPVTSPPRRIEASRRSAEYHRDRRSAELEKKIAVAENGNDHSAEDKPDYDTPWEFTCSLETAKLARSLPQPVQPPATAKKPESKYKLNRQHLSLNFGCAALNASSAKIDVALPLNEQMWYHGNITRAEAEQRLSKASEGSFLVRVCESSSRHGEEYALSLKSAKGFMHMKIQQDAQRNWILGYFSQPFESVPVMIRYYSNNKLPIKGAEHMRLLRPVPDQVL